MTRRLNEWIELSEVKRFGHHDLRHSSVSLLANAGFNDFQAAKRMGHDVRMFNEVYGHLFPNSQKDMAKAMDEYAKNSM
jgi:integrase